MRNLCYSPLVSQLKTHWIFLIHRLSLFVFIFFILLRRLDRNDTLQFLFSFIRFTFSRLFHFLFLYSSLSLWNDSIDTIRYDAPLERKLKTYRSFPLRHRRFYRFRLFRFILLYSPSHDVFPFFKGISRGPLSPFVPAFVQFCCGDRALLARMPSKIAGKSSEPEGFRETAREKRDKGLCNRIVASNTEPFGI